MIAYADSSAVLAWLLGEPEEAAVRQALAGAERVGASTLTALECSRALARGVMRGRLALTDELAALQLLAAASSSWVTLEMTGRVLDRARARFPVEPVRTLDALHLATALMFHEAHGSLT
ncbi:MAG: PIN domain-containing protein, partial [Gemmatimonadetes bacterium]|nr:PIN domain-containing protein [Gemmatimonadota bacterium]